MKAAKSSWRWAGTPGTAAEAAAADLFEDVEAASSEGGDEDE